MDQRVIRLMPKLYKNISKFHVRRHVKKNLQNRLKWALTLKKGDMINDCSGYNVEIIDIEEVIVNTSKGFYIFDIEFHTKNLIGTGTCSLRHCGVEKPKNREEVEKYILDFNQYFISSGQLKRWSIDEKSYQKELNRCRVLENLVKNGKHFTDKLGRLLPEFQKSI